MPETTWEEASRCPKCKQPGVVRATTKAPGRLGREGAVIKHVYCQNSSPCPWYNTCWLVQVNRDGSVPPPTNHAGQPKVYQGFEGHNEQAEQIKAYIDRLRKDAERQKEPGAEIRNPYG